MTSVDDFDSVAVEPWCSAYSLGLRSRNPCPGPAVWVDATWVLGVVIFVAAPVFLVAPELVDGDADGDALLLP